MTNPVHLLSVAGLLLIAFLVGAVIGSLARVLNLRSAQKPTALAPTLGEATVTAAPLVAAPVIAPLPVAPVSVAPDADKVPVPDFASTMIALASENTPDRARGATEAVSEVDATPEQMQPAHVAGETTSGILVALPLNDPSPTLEPVIDASEHRSADVIPFPDAALEATSVVSEDSFLFVGAEPDEAKTPAVAAQDTAAETAPVPVVEDVAVDEPVVVPVPAAAAAEAPEAVAGVVSVPVELAAGDAMPEAETLVGEQPAEAGDAAVVAAQPEPVADRNPLDEDAAMRAIEGGWTPRRRPAGTGARAVTPPEGVNQAVAASARAVADARRTAEAVVAEAKVEAGRPTGLDGPRDGRKDELAHIIGVLPVIETALNQLGIYHFDQLSGLSDENVGWIEGHLGIPGRISRELWREQARELSAVLKPKRAAEH